MFGSDVWFVNYAPLYLNLFFSYLILITPKLLVSTIRLFIHTVTLILEFNWVATENKNKILYQKKCSS